MYTQILRKRYPYSEFFCFVFFRIRTEYVEIRSISPYSVQMRENTDHKISECGHFSRSEKHHFLIYLIPLYEWIRFWLIPPPTTNLLSTVFCSYHVYWNNSKTYNIYFLCVVVAYFLWTPPFSQCVFFDVIFDWPFKFPRNSDIIKYSKLTILSYFLFSLCPWKKNSQLRHWPVILLTNICFFTISFAFLFQVVWLRPLHCSWYQQNSASAAWRESKNVLW